MYIHMNTHIKKWGNSFAIRIPKDILEKASLKEGEGVSVGLHDGVITLKPTVQKETLENIVSKITQKNRYTETDWGVHIGNEVW